MRRKFNPSYVARVFLSSLCFLLLVSCQQEKDDHFEILVFSSIPENALEEMKGLAKEELQGNTGFDVKLYPAVAERLLLEIVSNAGDILIMERDLLATAYDSDELYPLDVFRTKENTIELTKFELEGLQAEGEETKEDEVYLNALRVTNIPAYHIDSELIELVAIIPKYTKDKEVAISILEKLVQ